MTWFCEVLKSKSVFTDGQLLDDVMLQSPHHHVDQLGGQHDDNVAFVYLLRLHPLLGHLLRAKLNESKPS